MAKAEVKPIPEGYSTVVPYISVKGATEAIAYYKRAFAAQELVCMPMPDGRLGHAELKIGDSIVMMADEMDHPDAVAKSPRILGGVTSGLCVYVKDCDTVFNRAIEAGGKVRRPLTNQFYGDRSGTFEDPFGHVWTIATHVEDVPPDEMKRRMEAFTKGLRTVPRNPVGADAAPQSTDTQVLETIEQPSASCPGHHFSA